MKKLLSLIFILGVFVLAPKVHAVTPTLSLSIANDNNTVTANVVGDPNQSVILFYNKTGVGPAILPIGTTNGSGTLSASVNSTTNGIASGSPVHVSTGGLLGPQSQTISWPNVTNSTTTTVTLSQTGVVLSSGQTSTITATNTSGGTLYLSNNSNSAIANVNINGNQISITGISNGSTTATICAVGNTTNCPSVFITVQASGTQALHFSQSSLTLAIGQTVPVAITGGTGTYTILNNSNANIIQAVINGTNIMLTSASTTGSSSITVCSNNMSSCGIINVTAGTSNSSAVVSFGQTNPVLTVGQTVNISISGGGNGGSYYISTNSNPGVAQSSQTNPTTLTLLGVSSGTTTVTVCSSAGGCGALTVTVNFTSTGGSINLSQSTLAVNVGQTLSVTISGGQTPYSILNSSSGMYQANISGNVLSVTGVSAGSSWFNVCSAGGGCTTLTVNVSGTGTSNSGAPTFSQSNISITLGQSSTVSIIGTGTFFVSSNSAPTAVSTSLNGNSLFLTAINTGTANISICKSGGTCGTIFVTVTTSSTSGNTNPTPNPTPTPAPVVYTFTKHLTYGDNDEDVYQLQKLLVKLGYLTATPNGHFGKATEAAVKAFQKAKGLAQLGYIGPGTRSALNQAQSVGTSTKAQQIAALQAQIAQLQAQLVALQATQ